MTMSLGALPLATMLAVAAFPAYVLLSHVEAPAPWLVFGAAMLLFVCYTHRGNIARMRSGTENRANRLWLLRPRSQ